MHNESAASQPPTALAGDRRRSWLGHEIAPVRPFEGHRGNVFAADFSRDGSLLATGSDDGTVMLWDVERGVPLRELEHQGEGFAVQFSPDGCLLATPGSDRSIVIWAVRDTTS